MRAKALGSRVGIAVLLGLSVLTAIPAEAQVARLQPLGTEDIRLDLLQQQPDFTLCLEDVLGFVINVFSGPANSTVMFDVAQSVAGVVGFSTAETGPFADSLTVSVALDGNGNGTSDPFFVLGVMSGETVMTACSPQVGCIFNPQTLAVVDVATVDLEEIDSPLDANPNTGGGQRIFPGRQAAADTVDRRTVRIRATLSSPIAGVPVFFRSFDLDDPSTDASPVDANGAAGDDNRGTPQVGTLNGTIVQTDANGEAVVELTVTMQPGDNFRIAGACNADYLNGVVVRGVDLQDADGNILPTDRAEITEMLTVWRRVHIELDSMGLVAGNEITGTVATTRPNARRNVTRVVVNETLENARFEGGNLTIGTIGSFPVSANNRNSVTVQGVVPSATAAGQTYVLVDDDDFNNDDLASLDGDQGENVTGPDTGLIRDSDNAGDNVFAPAYVRPAYDVGDSNDLVAFLLNEAGGGALLIPTYDFDAAATEADDDFWTVYLLGAYQHVTTADADPSREGAVLGIVDAINGQGANVFNEVLRGAEINITAVVNNAATTAHEIGHLFGGVHGDGGLMAQSRTRSTAVFSDDTLATIRSLNHP